MKHRRQAISIFSGAGGMDIGVREAGFDILGDIEFDKHCCATLVANHELQRYSTKVINADIRTISPSQLMSDFSLEKGELDLLFGGPPCQSFSLAGKQLGLNDDRGLLLFEVIRFAREIQPKVIFIEQVKGLLSSKGSENRKGEVFETFLRELNSIGYKPKWRIMKAADYGVPQLRERLFIVATLVNNNFYFPEKTHAPKDECNGIFSYTPYVTVGDVLNNLGIPRTKSKNTVEYERLDSHIDVTPLRDSVRIAQVPEGSYLAAQTHLTEDILCKLSSKDTTKYLRLHRMRPSNTLRCGEIFYHPIENSYLTPREYMRIHGYPDDYVLKGPIRSRTGTVPNLDQHRQIANSVPPPLALAIARQIGGYLDEQNI